MYGFIDISSTRASRAAGAHDTLPPRAFAAPARDAHAARGPLTVRVVRDVDELRSVVPAVEDLAASAVEPNVFYEPWMLLPAVEHIGASGDLAFVLIEGAPPNGDAAAKTLCGLFPVERRGSLGRKPISNLSLFRHRHCYLTTPLLRDGCARGALSAFMDWAQYDGMGARVLQLPWVSGEGHIHRMLVDYVQRSGRPTFESESFTRARFRLTHDSAEYMRDAMTRKHRKELRRQRNRLADLGRVESVAMEPTDDVDEWIETFLALESSGWKGRASTALASNEADRRFFTDVARAAAERGRLHMFALRLSGRSIAQVVHFLSGEGGFSFKIAFDEELAALSPGVQLEVDLVHHLHERGDIRWLDSCAAADHPMINRIWRSRHAMRSLLVSNGSFLSDLAVASMPLLRWCKGRVLRRGVAATAAGA